MSTLKIKKEFPNLQVTDINGGCNVCLPNNVVLTFCFKERKWKSTGDKNWKWFADTKDIIRLIYVLGNIKQEKA